MNAAPTVLDNEKNVTELTIAPDGRIFVFGTSRQILEVLAALQPADEKLQRLLGHVHALEASQNEGSEP